MQTNTVVNHIASFGALALQLLLIAFTVWFLPTRLTTKWFGCLIFFVLIPLLWLAYSVSAMLIDGLVGSDVPGIGYLLVGFASGVIGFCIYVRRRMREKNA